MSATQKQFIANFFEYGFKITLMGMSYLAWDSYQDIKSEIKEVRIEMRAMGLEITGIDKRVVRIEAKIEK